MKLRHLEKYQHFVNPENQVSFDDGPLGGCNIYGDPGHELPKMMTYLLQTFNIKSIIDIGCGFGFHSRFFKDVFNVEVLGIEGSQKIVELSIIPDDIVCHDYTTGAYKPDKIYDLGWSIEFVEHIDEQHTHNFLRTFQNCKYFIMTHAIPGQAGHHHVNCKDSQYWIDLMNEYGFDLLQDVTIGCRKLATIDTIDMQNWLLDTSVSKPYRGPSVANYDNDDWRHKRHTCYLADTGLFFRNNNICQ